MKKWLPRVFSVTFQEGDGELGEAPIDVGEPRRGAPASLAHRQMIASGDCAAGSRIGRAHAVIDETLEVSIAQMIIHRS